MIILDIEPDTLAVPKSANKRLKYKNANIYQACGDAFVADAALDEKALLRSRYHKITKDGKSTRIILDKSAPDFQNMILESGTPVAPDEILETLKPLTLKIPIKYREDFAENQLPLAELLSAIQYYASHLDIPKNSLDETALLAFGVLAESWADEMVTDEVAEMFFETTESGQEYGPSSDSEMEYSLDNEEVCWSDEDSDIMSIEIEDSDTEEEQTAVRERSAARSILSSSSTSDFESSSVDSFAESGSDKVLDREYDRDSLQHERSGTKAAAVLIDSAPLPRMSSAARKIADSILGLEDSSEAEAGSSSE